VNLVDVPGPVPEPGTIWLILPVLALYFGRSLWRRSRANVE